MPPATDALSELQARTPFALSVPLIGVDAIAAGIARPQTRTVNSVSFTRIGKFLPSWVSFTEGVPGLAGFMA